MAEPADRPPAAANALPPLIFTAEEVAGRLGITAMTLKKACWAHKLPYRIKPRWIGPGRQVREMVFTLPEIQVLLDFYAPPVDRLQEISRLRRPPPATPKPAARPRGPRSSAQPAPPRRQEERS